MQIEEISAYELSFSMDPMIFDVKHIVWLYGMRINKGFVYKGLTFKLLFFK